MKFMLYKQLFVSALVSLFVLGSFAPMTQAQENANITSATTAAENSTSPIQKENKGLEAHIKTTKGVIVLDLYPEQAPLTVANFVNLSSRGYYNGLTFHRVIANFMIQGGDPTGTGAGGPGYKFKDECVASLRFDKPGVLAMANAGPGTNGSQFFITHVPTDWLNDNHTIFGQVKEGQNVVNSIKQGDKIEAIEIMGDFTELFDKCKAELDNWNKILDTRK